MEKIDELSPYIKEMAIAIFFHFKDSISNPIDEEGMFLLNAAHQNALNALTHLGGQAKDVTSSFYELADVLSYRDHYEYYDLMYAVGYLQTLESEGHVITPGSDVWKI